MYVEQLIRQVVEKKIGELRRILCVSLFCRNLVKSKITIIEWGNSRIIIVNVFPAMYCYC